MVQLEAGYVDALGHAGRRMMKPGWCKPQTGGGRCRVLVFVAAIMLPKLCFFVAGKGCVAFVVAAHAAALPLYSHVH